MGIHFQSLDSCIIDQQQQQQQKCGEGRFNQLTHEHAQQHAKNNMISLLPSALARGN